MLKNKKIFISGGAGVIGTAFVEKLNDLGAEIFVGDLKPRPKNWDKNIKYRQGDLNYITQEEVDSFKPEYFFHLAATFERAEESLDFWNENFIHNVKLSHHLMTCLKNAKSLRKVIFASSYLIYNPEIYTFSEKPKKAIRINETNSIYPRNTCGAAKLFHEIENRFLEGFDELKLQAISARIFRVYGKGSRDIISRWIRSLLKNETLTIYNQENQFDYIYADDVAEGLVKLAESSFSGIVNLTNDNSRSIKEVLQILKTHFPRMKTEFIDYNHPYEASQGSMEKFENITNWHPQNQLENCIPMIIDYERKNINEKNDQDAYMNLLVTSISKKIPQLKLIKKVNERLGNKGKVFGADSDKRCIGKYFVDSFWEMPKYNEMKIDEILSFCRTNAILCIIPTSDGELSFYARNKKIFLKNKINVMVSDNDALRICLDKLEFYNKLKNLGFPGIYTTKKIDEGDYDYFVVKEQYTDFGIQSSGIHLTKDQALSYAKTLKNPIFQPFIDGKELSIDLYIGKTGKVKGCIVRTRELVINGESQITESINNPKLEQTCSNLIEKLDLYGHVIMQVIVDSNNDFHIIECNNRFGGASSLSLEVGLDTFYWFLLESFGDDLNQYPFLRSKFNKKQIRYGENLIIQ